MPRWALPGFLLLLVGFRGFLWPILWLVWRKNGMLYSPLLAKGKKKSGFLPFSPASYQIWRAAPVCSVLYVELVGWVMRWQEPIRVIANCQTHPKILLQMSKETDNREFAFGFQHTDFLLIFDYRSPIKKEKKGSFELKVWFLYRFI